MDFSIIKAAGDVLPAVVGFIKSLVSSGRTPEEAAEIAKRDILSRAETYETEKAEDDKALEEKHGR